MSSHVVLITGAARGLGLALSRKFTGNGWQVIATDIDFTTNDEDLNQAGVLCIPMDISSDQAVADAFGMVRDKFRSIDLIINNAGIDRYFPFSEAPVQKFKEVFEINLFGGYRVNQTFIPILRRPGGRIIHIGSESLRLTLPFMPYPLSKNVLERYAKALRQELKFLGIDLVVVRPGPIRTAIVDKVRSIEYPVSDPVLQQAFRNFADTAPKGIGKVSQPDDVAEFIFRISQLPHPRAVYKFNNSLSVRILRFIPYCLLERLIMRKLGYH